MRPPRSRFSSQWWWCCQARDSPCLSFPSCTGGNTTFARCLGCKDEKCAKSLGPYLKIKPKQAKNKPREASLLTEKINFSWIRGTSCKSTLAAVGAALQLCPAEDAAAGGSKLMIPKPGRCRSPNLQKPQGYNTGKSESPVPPPSSGGLR